MEEPTANDQQIENVMNQDNVDSLSLVYERQMLCCVDVSIRKIYQK